MSRAVGPRQVLAQLLEGISHQRWAELHLLYAEHAIVRYPFALPAPTQLEGREAIRNYFAGVAKYPLELRARDIAMHEAEGGVVIVEWTYDGLVTTTGRSFEVANVQVSTVLDGLIVTSRDYHNHAALANATGRLAAVVASLSGT